jgi:hypothetical protein
MLRTILLLAGLSLSIACGGSAAQGDEGDPPLGAASSSEELAPGFEPAFVAGGAFACAAVRGAGGSWTAQSGAWSFCRDYQTFEITGCGYVWSSPAGAGPDVDALALDLGPFVEHLLPTDGQARPGIMSVCRGLDRPDPGSTPCGACQLGIATPTRVYLSLPRAYDEDTTLLLQTDLSTPNVVVHVPAHETTVTQTIPLSPAFAGGVPLFPAKSIQ